MSARDAWASIGDVDALFADSGERIWMESALAPLLGIGLSRGHGSVLAARAAFAEAGGDLEQALELYREAEERWIELGHRPERAHALLGEGRTLAALGRSIEARAKVEAASGIVAVLVRFG